MSKTLNIFYVFLFSFLFFGVCHADPSITYSNNNVIKHLHQRYLDKMAIIDEKNDILNQPYPQYAYYGYSVKLEPKIKPMAMVIIGDSILTGWSGYFAHVFPNAYINAKVGRQFSSALPIWQNLQNQGKLKDVKNVIFELGTNGDVFPADMHHLLKMIGPHRNVFLIVPAMPRSWYPEVRDLYYKTAKKYKNVHLVYWNRISRNHPTYFWPDMVHPKWSGIEAMMVGIISEVKKY